MALLPPEPIADLARELNRKLLAQEPEGFLLDETHLPHITLVQMSAWAQDRDETLARVERVLSRFRPLRLRIACTRKRPGSAWLVIEPQPELQCLHEALVHELRPLAGAVLVDASFDTAGGAPPRPRDLEWVDGFLSHASDENFEPHISIGPGTPPELGDAISFEADRVALCQLGRHCTCRRILGEWALKSS